ncbi:hypothetical protein QM716_28065 [Rhodococcus sp. IEGM 1409]|uniref:hypothetical protein n=1 Tax=Rhodococcus sp. IEGM 1409 TaxID=3047082 RepID=UPI0024B833F0|nr:hypothetical protein [Rhodococcus sp. IEGM 1409]MDI9903725.1 hypothetical protein [Rhodococcus sp. IEGM 1409]
MAEWWNPSRRVERWWQTIMLAWLLVVVGPSTIDTVTTEPTAWNWTWLAIWLFATVGFAYGTAQAWRTRNNPQPVWLEGIPAPSESSAPVIPADDVRSALASADGRIPAIKALREQHPGLGLKDAMDLIDAQRGEQGPHRR